MTSTLRFAPLSVAGATLAALVLAVPAHADIAASKALVDAAKARGEVGEQADGFLGMVSGGAGAVRAAVAEINAARAEAYRDTAAKAGTPADAAGAATARQLMARVPPGQFFKPEGGGWQRK